MLRSTSTTAQGVLASHAVVTALSRSHGLWFQSLPISHHRFRHTSRNPLLSNSSIIRWKRKANSCSRSGMATSTTRAAALPLKNADELIDSVETFIFDCDGM